MDRQKNGAEFFAFRMLHTSDSIKEPKMIAKYPRMSLVFDWALTGKCCQISDRYLEVQVVESYHYQISFFFDSRLQHARNILSSSLFHLLKSSSLHLIFLLSLQGINCGYTV